MPTYREAYRRSIDEPEAFWAEQARRIHWQTPFDQVLDRSKSAVRALVRRRQDQSVP